MAIPFLGSSQLKFLQCFPLLVLLVLVPNGLGAADQTEEYRSSKVCGVSFSKPKGWTVEENFDQSEPDRIGYLSFWIRATPLESLGTDPNDPISKYLKLLNESPPEMLLRIEIHGIGNPEPLKDQRDYVLSTALLETGGSINQIGKPAEIRVAGRELLFTTAEVGRPGEPGAVEHPDIVMEGWSPGAPMIFIHSEAPTMFTGERMTQFDSGVKEILTSLSLPENLLADPKPRSSAPVQPHSSGQWFAMVVGGWYYLIVVTCLLLIALAPFLKIVRKRFLPQYTAISALVVFYVIYAQLFSLLVASIVFVVSLVSATLSGIAHLWPLGTPRQYVEGVSSAIWSAGMVAAAIFTVVALGAQLRKSPRDEFLLEQNNSDRDALLAFVNRLPRLVNTHPFDRLRVTLHPEVHVESSLSGSTTLWLGLPFLVFFSNSELSALLTHEAAHNDSSALLFYRVSKLILTRMSVQEVDLRARQATLSDSKQMEIRDPNSNVDLRALLSMILGSMIWLERNTLNRILEAIRAFVLSPMMWQFELHCDKQAGADGNEERYANTLLFAANIQTSWKYCPESNRNVGNTDELVGLYLDMWLRGRSAVQILLDTESPCNGHPPLTQRLTLLGYSKAAQRAILSSISPCRNSERLNDFPQLAFDLADKKNRTSPRAEVFRLARIEQAGLLPIDM
jgi:hypothetical protein